MSDANAPRQHAPDPEPDVLTLEEAATIARLDFRTVRDAIERGEAPGRRVGATRGYRIPRDAFMRYLEGQ